MKKELYIVLRGRLHYGGSFSRAWSDKLYGEAKVPRRANSKHRDPEVAECWVTISISKISTITYCYAMNLYCIIQDGQMQKYSRWSYVGGDTHD